MSIVQGLVVAHVSATALLLLVFLAVVLWQRLTALVQRDAAPAVAYPSDAERSAAPSPVAAGHSGAAPAAPSVSARELQPS